MAPEGGQRRELGDRGERFAACFLEAKGFEILERNYRCQVGEVDLVAQEGECLVFVEVRSRSSDDFGTPEESITQQKRRRLAQVAECYVAERGSSLPAWRIDVVAVDFGPRGSAQRVELFRNAVTG